MERLGSLRVLFALDDLAEQRFDCPSVLPWAVDESSLTPVQTARLWYYEDLQRYLETAYDGRMSEAFERRRSELSTVFAMMRGRRAGDLSDLGWCPNEKRGYDHVKTRRQYHWIRAVIREYGALCKEQATVLRRLATAITKPLPAPKPRPPEPPKEPYGGVHPDHLTARICDICRRQSVAEVGEGTVTARWLFAIDNPEKLRAELDFIMAPAKVTECGPLSVTLVWEVA